MLNDIIGYGCLVVYKLTLWASSSCFLSGGSGSLVSGDSHSLLVYMELPRVLSSHCLRAGHSVHSGGPRPASRPVPGSAPSQHVVSLWKLVSLGQWDCHSSPLGWEGNPVPVLESCDSLGVVFWVSVSHPGHELSQAESLWWSFQCSQRVTHRGCTVIFHWSERTLFAQELLLTWWKWMVMLAFIRGAEEHQVISRLIFVCQFSFSTEVLTEKAPKLSGGKQSWSSHSCICVLVGGWGWLTQALLVGACLEAVCWVQVFSMSPVLLAPVSYLTHGLLMAEQYEQEKKKMMPPGPMPGGVTMPPTPSWRK